MADPGKRPTPRKGSPRKAAATPRQAARPASRPVAGGRAATRPAARPVAGARATARPAARPKPAPRAASAAGAKTSSTGSMPAFLSARKPSATGPVGTASRRPAAAAAGGRARREQHQRAQSMKIVMGVIAAIVGLGLVALLALVLLRDSPVFSIDSVTADPTEHVTADDIQKLLKVDAGSTLLNLDEEKVEAGLKKNSWVASVSFEKEFPHSLKVVINEQVPDALVVMSSGSIAWYMSADGTWIEPVKVNAADGESVDDAALTVAAARGVVLITGVPATVSPEAGAAATDATLAAVKQFREGFSSSFAAEVASYKAPSADAVSCVLKSGVEISLGSASNISYKEQIVQGLLQKYPNQLTYINVRTPSNTTVRKISSTDVQAGTSLTGESATSSSSTTSTTSSSSSTSADEDAADADASTSSTSTSTSGTSGSTSTGTTSASTSATSTSTEE